MRWISRYQSSAALPDCAHDVVADEFVQVAGHSVIFADLPTNGLDSANAFQLVKTVQLACCAGRRRLPFLQQYVCARGGSHCGISASEALSVCSCGACLRYGRVIRCRAYGQTAHCVCVCVCSQDQIAVLSVVQPSPELLSLFSLVMLLSRYVSLRVSSTASQFFAQVEELAVVRISRLDVRADRLTCGCGSVRLLQRDVRLLRARWPSGGLLCLVR